MSQAPEPPPKGAPTLRIVAMPSDTNPEGDIFGGWLMSQMDLAGATEAFRLAGGRCVTVALDGMVFLNPVAVGDEVSFYTAIAREGRTSVQVTVQAWGRPRDRETMTKVTEGHFTYVAIDEAKRPRPLKA